MRAIFATLAIVIMAATLTATAEAKNKKPMAFCVQECPNGSNAVVIYYDTDADDFYDKRVLLTCDGTVVTQNGNWDVVDGQPVPESGPFSLTMDSALNPNTEIFGFEAVLIRDGAVVVRLRYDGAVDGEAVQF